MSNPNDPYDPNNPNNPNNNQESWGAPADHGQSPSNDWGAQPQQGYGHQQQDYGHQQQGGPMMHQPGPPGMKTPNAPLESNDILAIVLSAFFPGAGQIVLGQTTKGLVWLIVSLFTCGVGGLMNIAAAVDAYAVANAKKKRAIGEWEFFPDLTNK